MRPWRPDEGDRLEDRVVTVDFPVPGLRALYVTDGEEWAILVDRRLGATERLAAIAHELVHHERGGGCCHPGMPDSWRDVVRREEARVERIAARRLVPPADLAEFVDDMLSIDLPVDAGSVAEHFEVPIETASRALEQLEPADHMRRTA